MQRRQYTYLVINQGITLQMAGSLDCFPFYSFVGLNHVKIIFSLGAFSQEILCSDFYFFFKSISDNTKTQQSSRPCCLHPTKFKVLFCSCAQLHLSSYVPLQKNIFFSTYLSSHAVPWTLQGGNACHLDILKLPVLITFIVSHLRTRAIACERFWLLSVDCRGSHECFPKGQVLSS